MADDQVSTLITMSQYEEPGQRAVTVPFLMRNIPSWSVPPVLPGDSWRNVVRNQPVAMICKQTIIDTLVASPWQIASRSPVNDYEHEVDYYTHLIEEQDGGYDVHTELVLSDTLDIPMGGVTEIGRENDEPDGKVLWYQRIDGATCMPSYNLELPVIQWQYTTQPILFPKHAINRMYYSPRPEITRKGWGMAPPERIYLGFELLYRGDRYYANLLLDTPEAGLLDLGDMSYDAASKWLESWRTLLFGTDSLKVPVLYEHVAPAKFIPFGRSPVELAYPQATLRYMQILSAGYGLTLADIGIVEGETGTLAGAIRSERRTSRTGIGVARRKSVAYWGRMLPSYLKFEYIERDDEALVAKGRARLANSMAFRNMVDGKFLEPADALQQMIADGMITVSAVLPKQEPEPVIVDVQQFNHPVANQLQKPVPASDGGAGEIKTPPGAAKSWVVERAETIASEFNKELVQAVVIAGGVPILDDPVVEITNPALLIQLESLVGIEDPTEEITNLIVPFAVPVVGQSITKLWKGE